MDASKPIILYDIASGPPVTCFAPNPWKARYALNFKGVNYRTEWVDLPDIKTVREKLGIAPNRTHSDGSAFYTLPIIQDSSTGDIIGDTFEIALYLDRTYPNGPTLLPPMTVGLQAAFNIQVDAIFSQHVILCVHGMPLNPETAEISKATFAQRAGKESWEELTVRGEERVKTLESLKAALDGLAKCYRQKDGLFLEGDTVLYADLIVGSWLAFYKITLKEWEEVQTWHNGLWQKLHQALEKYAEVK
ncbi:hypothetical protein EYZ11_001616 [Aspergillus tanneri]|uniref:GST N-terminal domain-containing protein n=1 Tax=Aspergillus tanneri TaxID=1220188 RepID=A0A4S3JSS0_9EURO|nr:uncharacterized protein ATNIH1004_006082 [Aspergillus tanneri]KAA8647389.1 hypothetical protein ATNIH1004_006082 [Aspergillus tanneri]THC98903.1 hypothetical protein EYZ11_001616 [Aspergillus tanneri]